MKTYQTKMEPRPAQVEALARLRDQRAFALLMQMRTGKTKVILDDYGRLELAGEINDLLVIAPGGVYKTWAKAWREHVSDDLQKRAMVHIWESSKKQSALDWKNHTGPRVLFMNVEALSKVAAARLLCAWMLRMRPVMFVVDESTCIKSPKAKRAKYIVNTLAPHAHTRRILSGLPTPRSPLDAYMQFAFLDQKIIGQKSYWAFRNRYAQMGKIQVGGRLIDIVVGYQNQDELRRRIEPYSYRVEFRPQIPSTYSIVDVPMTPQQQRVYTAMKEYATAQLEGESHVTATIVITQLLRLHQILCGFVTDEQGVIRSLPETRTGALIKQLDRGGGKAVIWCSYDYSIRKVYDRLIEEYGEPSTARFWGGNVNQREDEEKRFLEDPDCQFMLATPDAGGKGRTWSVADTVIYYSSTNDLEKRDQSEYRVQGVEKQRQVDYIDLITPDTVEIKILQALRNKINMAATITGFNWKEWLL